MFYPASDDCTSGFDIVIGNPPYIKEYDNKDAFNGFREQSPYYMGKMDLWYGFACHSLDLICPEGHLCFIAQNNWTTSKGAKLLREKVIEDSKINQLIDFNTLMIFENASIQTMIMLFEKNKSDDDYVFDYRTLLGNANKEDYLKLLNKQKTGNTKYLTPSINREKLNGKLLTFNGNESLFDKIANGKVYLDEKEVAQGIVFPQDFLDTKNALKLGSTYKVGDCIFGLTKKKIKELCLSNKEKEIIKPYFTTEQIQRYYVDVKNDKWLIYTDSTFKKTEKMNSFPILKKHIDQFSSILTSDNKPYGLHRAREEHFFKGEKIVSLRKCVGQPSFSYCDFDTYVTQTFFIIQTSRWNMKFLTGVLNSKLVAFWLKNKGKMQGANYQVDKEPLLSIPLPNLKTLDTKQISITTLVDKILVAKKSDLSADTATLESQINQLVYQLYGLTVDEIDIVEGK